MSRPRWQTDELDDELDVDWGSSDESDVEDVEDRRTQEVEREVLEDEADMSLDLDPPPAALRVSPTADMFGPQQPKSQSPTPPGTFVVHTHIQQPRINADSAAKSFFSPLKLESMFRPPEPTSPTPPSSSVPGSSSGGTLSAYRPRRPSHLSQVHLPEPPTPTASTALSFPSIIQEVTEHSGTRSMAPSPSPSLSPSKADLQRPEDEIVETDIPNLATFDGRAPSSSFRFNFPVPPRPRNPTPPTTPDPRLRLFQLQYDTFTRAHLSAMVDSIGVESATPSGSSSTTPGSGNGSSGSERARKRIRVTSLDGTRKATIEGNGVPSTAQAPAASRDYLKESKELMNAIRTRRTVSGSSSEAERPRPTVSLEWPSPLADGDLDLRTSTRNNMKRRHSDELESVPSLPSSRHSSSSRPPQPQVPPGAAPSRRSVNQQSQAPASGLAPASHVDLNRYISTASNPTARTVSASSRGSGSSGGTIPSFTKHPGPPSPLPPPSEFASDQNNAASTRSQMRSIRPEDVADVLQDRVGGMMFDHQSHKWVKRRSLSVLTEASRESGDVFGGIESLSDGNPTSIRPADERATEQHNDTVSSPPPALMSLPLQPIAAEAEPEPATAPCTPAPNRRTQLPVPPRSALKNVSNPGNVAASSPLGSVRRSVSFSDGRKVGPIVGLGRAKLLAEGKENENTFENSDDEDVKEGQTFASARGKRIAGLLEQLQELSIEGVDQDDPNDPNEEANPLSVSRPSRRRAAITHDSPLSSPSSLASPPTFSLGRRSSRSFTQANATFLTECSFGVAHDALVKFITDVQPYEPYWEQLNDIDLSGKGIESLARLKEYLPAVERVNLDNNKVAWLTGLPLSVRHLSIASNLITGLTAYTHVRKIEYLNISNNQVDSVFQLAGLSHLHELRADNNCISSLEGLSGLPLRRLSLKKNALEAVDLCGLGWASMEHLDLSNNRIKTLTGLEEVGSLVSLSIESNQLVSFTIPRKRLGHLRILRLSDNRLTMLEVEGGVNLKTLYADNNRLEGIFGLRDLRKLENLSLRNQQGQLSLELKDLRDVKRLYLSGNALSPEFFSEPLYTLIYCELAACQLSELPPLQPLLPNVRVLNLNYNHLKSFESLRGLSRLRKVTAIGSRLHAVRKISSVLEELGDLESLDLRMNPCTLGWYLPILVSSASDALQPHENAPTSRGNVSAASYIQLDAKHRKGLPDELYVARGVWRGLVMEKCPSIRVLDGLEITEKERVKTQKLLSGLGVSA